MISKISAKSSSLDPLPAHVLRGCFSVLLPEITKMVNVSLENSVMSDGLKSAVLEPGLKRSSMDTDDFSSFNSAQSQI